VSNSPDIAPAAHSPQSDQNAIDTWGGFVPQNRTIIISKDDFTRLHALMGHARLATELQRAAVLNRECVPPNVITMNSKVRFEDESTGEIRDVTIVFPADAEPSRAKVSVLATVGMALLGLSEGHTVLWPFPDGTTRSLRVVKLLYQPEPE
jgi:regulator of nucleoside diphosphate kinase